MICPASKVAEVRARCVHIVLLKSSLRIVQSQAMHILVVTPAQASLWHHDCMLYIILQVLMCLGNCAKGFA